MSLKDYLAKRFDEKVNRMAEEETQATIKEAQKAEKKADKEDKQKVQALEAVAKQKAEEEAEAQRRADKEARQKAKEEAAAEKERERTEKAAQRQAEIKAGRSRLIDDGLNEEYIDESTETIDDGKTIGKTGGKVADEETPEQKEKRRAAIKKKVVTGIISAVVLAGIGGGVYMGHHDGVRRLAYGPEVEDALSKYIDSLDADSRLNLFNSLSEKGSVEALEAAGFDFSTFTAGKNAVQKEIMAHAIKDGANAAMESFKKGMQGYIDQTNKDDEKNDAIEEAEKKELNKLANQLVSKGVIDNVDQLQKNINDNYYLIKVSENEEAIYKIEDDYSYTRYNAITNFGVSQKQADKAADILAGNDLSKDAEIYVALLNDKQTSKKGHEYTVGMILLEKDGVGEDAKHVVEKQKDRILASTGKEGWSTICKFITSSITGGALPNTYGDVSFKIDNTTELGK